MAKKSFDRLTIDQLVSWWNHYVGEKEIEEGRDLFFLFIHERESTVRLGEPASTRYNPEHKWARFLELENVMESTDNPLPWISMDELNAFFDTRTFAVRKTISSENVAVFETLEDAVHYAVSVCPDHIVVELDELGQVKDKWPA